MLVHAGYSLLRGDGTPRVGMVKSIWVSQYLQLHGVGSWSCPQLSPLLSLPASRHPFTLQAFNCHWVISFIDESRDSGVRVFCFSHHSSSELGTTPNML